MAEERGRRLYESRGQPITPRPPIHTIPARIRTWRPAAKRELRQGANNNLRPFACIGRHLGKRVPGAYRPARTLLMPVRVDISRLFSTSSRLQRLWSRMVTTAVLPFALFSLLFPFPRTLFLFPPLFLPFFFCYYLLFSLFFPFFFFFYFFLSLFPFFPFLSFYFFFFSFSLFLIYSTWWFSETCHIGSVRVGSGSLWLRHPVCPAPEKRF